MKKYFFAAIIFSLAAALFAVDAEVVSVVGKAQVKQGASWSDISQGMSLPQGAEIQTGFKSTLVLKIKGSLVTVNAMSRISLDELSESGGKDNTNLSLKIGSLKSNVKKVEDRRTGFTVRGPAATASVRGTEFTYVAGYKGANISASEGVVAVWKGDSSDSKADEDGSSSESAQTPENISDGTAGAGAFTITVGQTASFTETGTRDAQANARLNSDSMGGAVASASSSEAVTTTSSSTSRSESSKESSAKYGTVVVTVTFQSSSY